MLLLIPGLLSEVVVQQPPIVFAAVGQDVLLPCVLQLSGQSLKTNPVFYWTRGTESVSPSSHVQQPGSERTPTNQPLFLRGVRWADSGSYLCKVSVRTEQGGSFRRNGSRTKLLLYDNLLFERCRLDQALLCCEGKVTQDAAFSLSIFHDGQRLQAAGPAAADADADAAQAQPFTLSKGVALQGAGRYECRLLLGEGLMTKSLFILNDTEAGGGGANTTSASSNLPAVGVYPEPWLLYGVLLLVPVIVLLGLVTAMLTCRRGED
ncbi:uncharacterized protein LOC105356059 isoform X2 [Oryzias latipes]|nr:uncharacterized protein LOC105356059 isoform X2 [Oryzias latipes]